MPQPVVARGVDGGHDHRVLGADSIFHRHAHHLVDVPLLDDEPRLAVVGAEHAPVAPVSLDEGEQVAQVAGDRSFAKHHPHPEAPFLQRLFVGGRFVVGPNARGDVGVESRPANARRVAVDVVGETGLQLRHLGFGAGDDAGEVHHLGDADRAVPAQQALDVAGGERSRW